MLAITLEMQDVKYLLIFVLLLSAVNTRQLRACSKYCFDGNKQYHCYVLELLERRTIATHCL